MAVSAKEIILISVAFVLIAVMVPIGMTQVLAANTTGWDASVKTIFVTLLPVIFIIGAALYFIPRLGKG